MGFGQIMLAVLGLGHLDVLGGLLVLGLGWGGWTQGRLLADSAVGFTDISKAMTLWFTVRTGGLALDSVDFTTPGVNPDLWERVIAKLRAGSMPPPGRPRRWPRR